MVRREDALDLMTDEGLTMALTLADKGNRYRTHEAMWWNTDVPIPMVKRIPSEGVVRMAVPVVWKATNKDMIMLLLTDQVTSQDNYNTIYDKRLRDYMKTPLFVKAMRRYVPPFDPKRDAVLDKAMRRTRLLLNDRPSKIASVKLSWREPGADLLFSPIAMCNTFAQVIWVDPLLKDEDPALLEYIVYHEFCVYCSTSYVTGKVKGHQLRVLHERYKDEGPMLDALDVMGWMLDYDPRYYQRRDETDDGLYAQLKAEDGPVKAEGWTATRIYLGPCDEHDGGGDGRGDQAARQGPALPLDAEHRQAGVGREGDARQVDHRGQHLRRQGEGGRGVRASEAGHQGPHGPPGGRVRRAGLRAHEGPSRVQAGAEADHVRMRTAGHH